jgi:hypothetical protein
MVSRNSRLTGGRSAAWIVRARESCPYAGDVSSPFIATPWRLVQILSLMALPLLALCGGSAHAQGEVPPDDGAGERASSAAAGESAFKLKSFEVPRIDGAIRIDGRLDEAAWTKAAVLSDASQYSPGDGAAPTQRTEFLVAIDADNLYIAARFFDSDVAGVRRNQLVQGGAVVNDDHIQILLDTYNNRRTGYLFYVNPNSVQRDGLLLGGVAFNMDWDGIWEGRSEVTAEGWTTEIAIPFKTLSFDPDNDAWGINLLRSIRRRREEIAWSHYQRRITMDVTGEMRGMQGLRQGIGLDVVPSFGVSQRENFLAGTASTIGKPSLDAFYRITPSLTASMTLNTDFSATDVDDRQVNLTRFSLFFPEKRDFFLEDVEVFEFAGLKENGRPFFSRTIGLSGTGQPIDLQAGGKLTGKIGALSIGGLAVRQEEYAGMAAQDLFVGRGYFSFLEQSTIGGIVTYGDPTSERENLVVGGDLNLRDRTLLGGRLVEGRAWILRSRNDGFDGRNTAWGASVAYPNDDWDLLAGVTTLEEQFRPALGFVNRAGIEQYDGRAKYRHRFAAGGPFRSWLGGVEGTEIGDMRGRLESRLVTLTPFVLDTQPGDTIGLDLRRQVEILRNPFPLPGGLVVRPGVYEFDRVRLYSQMSGSRRYAWNFDVEAGDFYAGRRLDTRVGLQWRPGKHLFVNAQYQTNRIETPEREFTTRLYALTANVAFNVRWAWLNVAQYDNVSGRLGVNSRVRWWPTKGQVAYLVVNYDWREDLFGDFRPFVAETTFKFNYTFRF